MLAVLPYIIRAQPKIRETGPHRAGTHARDGYVLHTDVVVDFAKAVQDFELIE